MAPEKQTTVQHAASRFGALEQQPPGIVRHPNTALLLLALLVAVIGGQKAIAQQQPPAPVVVAAVQQREVAEAQILLGTVMPQRQTIVGSAVDGRVLEYLVNDGDWVKAGQPITQLRTATIEIELAGANAELNLRQEALAELEISLPEEIAQSQAEVTRAQALLDYARSKRDRTERLFQQGTTITRDDLEQVLSVFQAAEQVHVRAQSSLSQLLRTRELRLSQAKARLAVQQETVNQLNDRIAKYTLRAPFDGYVTAKFTEVGAWISEGDPAAEIVELDPVEINVAVPEAHIVALHDAVEASRRKGEELNVQVRLDAAPDRVFTGQVARIVPQADPRTRSFPVKLRVKNSGEPGAHLLKAGMLANVALPVGARRQALLVPKDALVLGGPSPQVMAVVTDPKTKQAVAQAVPVQLGVAEGSLIQVIGQLQPGQQVVVRGNERLRPGQAVNVVEQGK